MPSAIDELIKRRVMQQWFNGTPRDKIAADNNIGTGTVSGIVNDYKTRLGDSDLESVRGLSMEIRKQELTFADLASHLRVYKFFKQSNVDQDQIEAFIERVQSGSIPQDKLIEYVNQLYDISREQSVPLDEVPNYIKQKLEEKQNIDQDIKEANDVLQKKNVTIEAIEEHLKLKEALSKHELSTQDVDKVVNLVLNAKENGYDSGKIVKELRSIERLEKRKNRAKKEYEIYAKLLQKCKDVLPLTEEISALGIGVDELIAVKASINQAVKLYKLPPLAAILRLMEDIRKYNLIGGLEQELRRLSLQKIAITEACARQSVAFVKMQNQGL
ncbi:MAG TPA: hypothetical protein VJ729_17385 [Nitrososphaeraceae archaeon]|nr:hypothetical protein [Nitrososphaeraceae archaeon]